MPRGGTGRWSVSETTRARTASGTCECLVGVPAIRPRTGAEFTPAWVVAHFFMRSRRIVPTRSTSSRVAASGTLFFWKDFTMWTAK